MTHKEKTRKKIDAHIETTKGSRKAGGRMKGARPEAWAEILALQKIMEATKA